MPFINISVGGADLTKQQKQRLFQETTRLMSEVMGKNADLTAVRIDAAAPQDWSIGARTLEDRAEITAHMDIKVTQGTNSDAEKKAMIAESSAMLKSVLGPLAEASYVVVDEVDAASWGYDGRTQASRRG